MRSLFKIFNALINIGVTPDLDPEQVRPVRMTNRMNFYGLILCAIFTTSFFVMGASPAAYAVMCGAVCLCVSFLLNKKGFFLVAPIVGTLSASAVILIICLMSSLRIDGQYMIIAETGMPLLMINRRKWRVILSVSSVPIISMILLLHAPHFDLIHVEATSLDVLNEAMIYAGTVLVVLQITHYYLDMARDNEVIRKQQHMLMESSRMSELGLMAAGVAHEINNPLMVIRGRAEVLRMKLKSGVTLDTASLESTCESIEKSVERVAKIIQGLKHLSRDGNADPFIAVSLDSIIQEIYVFCKERLEKSSIGFRIIGVNPKMLIKCRSVQIGQVLVCLIGNSIDAISDLGDKWISIVAADHPDHVEIRIVDSGKGIDKAVARRMMQAFYTTKAVGRGTGLGLSISQSIIEQHHGELKYLPDQPHTTFMMTIPKAEKLEGDSLESPMKKVA